MLALALSLAITGSALLVGSILTFRHRRGDTQSNGTTWMVCEAPSPDDSLNCTQELGHYGWHRSGETSWFGDAWDVDQWADTEEAPIADSAEPTMSVSDWNKKQYPDIIGPYPLKFRIGIMGNRY